MNVDEVDFTNKRQKLSSPRSREACRRLGVQIKELYFTDFAQFRSENPGIINLSKEAQSLRWEHQEENRSDLVDMVRREREKIIHEQMKESSKEHKVK